MGIEGVLHVDAISQSQPVAKPDPPDKNQADQTNSSPAAVTVSVSSESKAMLSLKAAAQEAMETHAQTAQEARKGDIQAQRLLAKEAAHVSASAIGKGGEVDKLV